MSFLRLRRHALAWTLFGSLVLLPTGAAALITLNSGGGFIFDVVETSGGYLSNGSADAYDACYYLAVNGSTYSAFSTATTSLGGRQIDMAPQTIGALQVERHVYVPLSGGNWARYLDVVTTPGTSDVSATLRISGNLGSDTSTVVTGSSSGDSTVTTADTWFATDDTLDGSGDPALAHVFQGGPGSLVSATMASISFDNLVWEFSVTVPAGGRVAILGFAVQENTRAASLATAASLVDLPPETMLGLDAYVGDIVNFPVGGAPVVRFTSPSEIDEGQEVTIEVMVTDLEGDTPSWSWDLDGDGVFGEMPGGTSYTVPAGATDGDADITIAIEATDGTETRTVTRTVTVHNLPPVVTSEPPLEAFVRREYSYQITVEDPAGPVNDPPDIRLTSRPSGMEVTPEGLVTWTPPIDARARSFPVIARVLDGDGGEDVQMWEVAVAENQPPEPPTPMSPIMRSRVAENEPVTLTVTNGMDPDGDPLEYYFQLSRTVAFEGADVFGSGAVSEGTDGTTSWTTAGPLEPGLWYWRVWDSDGIVDSHVFNATFIVGLGPVEMPDGGSNVDAGVIPGIDAGLTTPRGDGCSCSSVGTRGRSGGALACLFVLGALILRRRRLR